MALRSAKDFFLGSNLMIIYAYAGVFLFQVLGDIIESIAGAILIDTYLNLDAVWDIFKSLFSPIVTPDNLELPPLRKLSELCSYFGYFIHTKGMKNGEEVLSELTVQLKDDLLVGCGRAKNMKTAKAQAALCLLKQLKVRWFYLFISLILQ